jgi:molybdenum cofactor synthesis domain-containing protein
MIPIQKAVDIVLNEVEPLGVETVNIADAVGRVLSEDIKADSDLPPFDRSQMDGFAMRAADTAGAPVLLTVVGESAAGHGWHKTLKTGQAVRIMTGASVPKGADAVQKVELTLEIQEGPNIGRESVTILEPTKKGKYIVPKGFEVKKGSVVLQKGTPVTPEAIAVLAAFGYSEVKVGRKPRLAVLATGSEIVDLDEKPGRDQIRNSNSHTVRALAERIGCEVKVLPIARDDMSDLKDRISNAASQADIVVITGGVSVGKYDLTKSALSDVGAEILFDRIRLKPGKPTVFARLGSQFVFGLPGNPVSVAVTFYLFVRAAALKMQGASEVDMHLGYAVAARPVKGTKERDSYLPAVLKTDKTGRLVAEPISWHGSSDFVGFARANALIVAPRAKNFEKGDVVRIAYL